TTFGTNLIQPTGLLFGTGADANSLYVSNIGFDAQFNALGQVSKVADAPAATDTTAADTFVAPRSGGFNLASRLAWQSHGTLVGVDLGATSTVGQILEFTPDGSFNHVFTAADSLDFQFPSDAVFDDQGRLIVADLGPARPPVLAGSIVRFRADG